MTNPLRKLLRYYLPVFLVPVIVDVLGSLLFYGDVSSCLKTNILMRSEFVSEFRHSHTYFVESYISYNIFLFVIGCGWIRGAYHEYKGDQEKAATANGVIFILAVAISLAGVLLGAFGGVNSFVWRDAAIILGMAAIKTRIKKFRPGLVWSVSILVPLAYQLIMRLTLLNGHPEQYAIAHYTDAVFAFLPFFLMPVSGIDGKVKRLGSCLREAWAMLRREEFPLYVAFDRNPLEEESRMMKVVQLMRSLNLSFIFLAFYSFVSTIFAYNYNYWFYDLYDYTAWTHVYPEGYPGFSLMVALSTLAEWAPCFFIPAYLYHALRQEEGKKSKISSIAYAGGMALAGIAIIFGIIALGWFQVDLMPGTLWGFWGIGAAVLLTGGYLIGNKVFLSSEKNVQRYRGAIIVQRLIWILLFVALGIAQSRVYELSGNARIYGESVVSLTVWSICTFLALVPYILIPLYEDIEYPRLKRGVEQIRELWRKLAAQTTKIWNTVKKYLGEYWKVMLAAGIGVVIVILLAVGIGQLFSGNGGKDAPPIDEKPSSEITEEEDPGSVTPSPDDGIDPVTRKCSQCLGDKKCRYCLMHGSGECDECWGSGKKDCTCYAGDCTKCLGDGKIVVGDKTIKCTGCDGHGTHDKCKGTGKLDCTYCDGKGKCSACKGTGICPICD